VFNLSFFFFFFFFSLVVLGFKLRGFRFTKQRRAPVVHTCNPSYSDRDQKDHGSKPVPGKLFLRPYLKKQKSQERAGGVAQGVGPEFKPQFRKN
jgi:hypothetical protein